MNKQLEKEFTILLLLVGFLAAYIIDDVLDDRDMQRQQALTKQAYEDYLWLNESILESWDKEQEDK